MFQFKWFDPTHRGAKVDHQHIIFRLRTQRNTEVMIFSSLHKIPNKGIMLHIHCVETKKIGRSLYKVSLWEELKLIMSYI